MFYTFIIFIITHKSTETTNMRQKHATDKPDQTLMYKTRVYMHAARYADDKLAAISSSEYSGLHKSSGRVLQLSIQNVCGLLSNRPSRGARCSARTAHKTRVKWTTRQALSRKHGAAEAAAAAAAAVVRYTIYSCSRRR